MFTVTLFHAGVARTTVDRTAGTDYEMAIDIADQVDCDGDHDGITVTNEDGRILYSLPPVRFDAMATAEAEMILRASFGEMNDSDFS
jgi:hypothetical protein